MFYGDRRAGGVEENKGKLHQLELSAAAYCSVPLFG